MRAAREDHARLDPTKAAPHDRVPTPHATTPQALLHAVGLGEGAIPMAAALNWIIKDGLGQLGGLLAVAAINTKFDSDPKVCACRVPSSMPPLCSLRAPYPSRLQTN